MGVTIGGLRFEQNKVGVVPVTGEPKHYPSLGEGVPVPDRKGRIKKKELFKFMDGVTELVDGIIKEKRFGLIEKVWLIPFDKVGSSEQGGILAGLGVIETGETDEEFPYTPVLTMIPLNDVGSFEAWRQVSADTINEKMKQLVAVRLAEPQKEGRERLGGKGRAIIGVHGWTGNPFVWWRQIRHYAAKMKDTLDLQKSVFFFLGTQGSLGTTRGIPQEKSIEMVPTQVEKTMQKIGYELAGGEAEKINNFWRRIAVVFGHSMGAWVAAKLINGNFRKMLEQAGNYSTRWILMDSLIHGINISKAEKARLRKWFKISKFKGFVSLLEADIRGRLTDYSHIFIRNKVTRPIAKKLLSPTVRTFMGGERRWESLMHEYSVGKDLEMVAANNHMLRNAPSIVGSEQEFNELVELSKTGRLYWVEGEEDRILGGETQKKVGDALEVPDERRLNSVQHYPRFDFLAWVAMAVRKFGEDVG